MKSGFTCGTSKTPLIILASLLVLVTLLGGCRPSTTVILPPETTATKPITPTVTTTAPVAITESTTHTTEPPTSVEPMTTEPTEISTQPPETKPPATKPPQTNPPATQPPETSPPASEVPSTAPAETEPPLTGVYDLSTHTMGSMEPNLLAEINQRRKAEGLPELSLSRKLSALAAIRAFECSQNPSHTRPDGRDFSTVLTDYGFSGWSTCKETLLQSSQGLPASILVDTMLSRDSSKSILLGSYSQIGIGIYEWNGLLYLAAIFTE